MKTNLPPQAYTREVFANAYEWLQSQSNSTRELAQTPDDLVALYLQARRHGHLNNTQNPHSNKSFKNDLKNLAEGLRQFEESQAPSASAVTEKVRETTKHSFTFTNPPPPPPNSHFNNQIIEEPYFSKEEFEEEFEEPQEPIVSTPKTSRPNVYSTRPNSRPQAKPIAEENYPAYKKSEPEKVKPSPTPTSWDLQNLDEKSKVIINDVKARLNLSRDEEALRMLLVLGREKLNEILPT